MSGDSSNYAQPGVMRIHTTGHPFIGELVTLLVDVQKAYVGVDLACSLTPDEFRTAAGADIIHSSAAWLHQLRVVRVTMESPGVWEFLGKLNPLQVLVEYIQQRHERLKDSTYRNDAERQRLELENQLLETKIMTERVDLMRKAGYSKAEIRAILGPVVKHPLEQLDDHIVRGIITAAEISSGQ